MNKESERWYQEYPVALRVVVVTMVVVTILFIVALGQNFGWLIALGLAFLLSVVGTVLVKRDIDWRAERKAAAEARQSPGVQAKVRQGPFQPRRSGDEEDK